MNKEQVLNNFVKNFLVDCVKIRKVKLFSGTVVCMGTNEYHFYPRSDFTNSINLESVWNEILSHTARFFEMSFNELKNYHLTIENTINAHLKKNISYLKPHKILL